MSGSRTPPSVRPPLHCRYLRPASGEPPGRFRSATRITGRQLALTFHRRQQPLGHLFCPTHPSPPSLFTSGSTSICRSRAACTRSTRRSTRAIPVRHPAAPPTSSGNFRLTRLQIRLAELRIVASSRTPAPSCIVRIIQQIELLACTSGINSDVRKAKPLSFSDQTCTSPAAVPSALNFARRIRNGKTRDDRPSQRSLPLFWVTVLANPLQPSPPHPPRHKRLDRIIARRWRGWNLSPLARIPIRAAVPLSRRSLRRSLTAPRSSQH